MRRLVAGRRARRLRGGGGGAIFSPVGGGRDQLVPRDQAGGVALGSAVPPMLCHKINPTLELRLLQPADAATLFAVIDADRVHLREWLPWVDDTKKVADSAKFIAKALREQAETRAFTSGIWSMGRLVGVIRHNRIDWASKVSFPTYWLASAAQGRGIMTQCCQAFYSHAFELLQVHRIVVAVATENKRGQALPLRLGFKQVSTLKKAERLHDRWVDHHIYSLLTPHAPPGSF